MGTFDKQSLTTEGLALLLQFENKAISSHSLSATKMRLAHNLWQHALICEQDGYYLISTKGTELFRRIEKFLEKELTNMEIFG